MPSQPLVLAAFSLVAWVILASCAADGLSLHPHQWARIVLSGDKPGPRKMHGLTAHGGTLYVYGGHAPGGHYLGTRVEECPARDSLAFYSLPASTPSHCIILTSLTDDLFAINPSTGVSTRLVQNTSQVMRTPPEARRPEVGGWQPVGRRLMVG
jgi:hypothetical protein